MSRSASSFERIVSFDSVSSIESKPANSARMSSLVRPRALRKTVTDCLRLRSMRTPTWSRLSISNSSHAPRLGMMRAETMSLSEVLSGVLVEVDAGRADELRDDDTLGAVDDERALAGLEREVAHEDRLGLDLTGLVVHELGLDVERGGVRLAALLALLDGVLLGLEVRVRERELHRLAQVLDRRDLLEDLLETADLGHVGAADALRLGDARLPGLVADEPVEGLGLQREQVRDRQRVGDLGEREAGCSAAVLGGGGGRCVARSSQGDYLRGPGRGSFPCRQGGVLIRPRKPGATLRFAREFEKRGHAGTADHHMRAGGIQERKYLLYGG